MQTRKLLNKTLPFFFSLLFLATPFSLSTAAATTTTITNGKYYAFQNVNSGCFLDVANGNEVSGNNIWQCVFNATEAQQFLVLGPESGISSSAYHQIAPRANTALRLDIANAWDADGANLGLFDINPGYGAQSFRFISNGDGSFRIMPYLSSTRVLSVESSSTASYANVELRTWTGSNSQRWILKEVDTYFIKNWKHFFRGSAATSYRKITTRFSSSHVGIDVPAPSGTAIYSPTGGEVIRRGYDTTMGNYVIISTPTFAADGRTITCRIMHMNASPLVSTYDLIGADTLLGYVGSTGDSTGAHVHIDFNSGGYINGSDIRNDFSSAIPPENLFPGVRFTYSSGYTYA